MARDQGLLGAAGQSSSQQLLPLPHSRQHVNEKKLSLRRVVPEIVHTAGEALLIDWGQLWSIDRNGKRGKLWAFVGMLGYSRYMVVKVTTSLTQLLALTALVALYDELGGFLRQPPRIIQKSSSS